MDDEEPGVVDKRVPERGGPASVAEERAEIFEPNENLLLIYISKQGELQCAEQRQDHDQRVDQDRRREENADMPAHRPFDFHCCHHCFEPYANGYCVQTSLPLSIPPPWPSPFDATRQRRLFAQRRLCSKFPPPCGAGWGYLKAKRSRLTALVLLSRLEPAIETILKLLGGGFRRLRAVDHIGRGHPRFVFQVGGAAVKNLIGGADRRLALLAPGNKLLS